LGIAQRLAALLRDASPSQAAALESGCARLVADDGMGTLFKVLALTAPDAPVPAGFTAAERRRCD
jgi:NADH dehydrogenase [ubiquinone] 1 alpha subcomplex assembly factor 7